MTSRERNPQFCGSPPRFRDRGFYTIQPEELVCKSEAGTTDTPITKKIKETVSNTGVGVATVVSADLDDVSLAESAATPEKTSTSSSTTTSTTTSTTVVSSTSTQSTSSSVSSTSSTTARSAKTTQKPKSTITPWRSNQRPPLVMGYPPRSKAEDNEVIVKNAFRQDNSVIIQWGSETANILGFRVVYRLFGDKTFKQGPPLEASEREFKIKNVPSQVSSSS